MCVLLIDTFARLTDLPGHEFIESDTESPCMHFQLRLHKNVCNEVLCRPLELISLQGMSSEIIEKMSGQSTRRCPG